MNTVMWAAWECRGAACMSYTNSPQQDVRIGMKEGKERQLRPLN